MNVFWLDSDYDTAARCMIDSHVGSKMIVEAAQIIGEALQANGFKQPFLRSGYPSHPLVKWAAESSENVRTVGLMASAMYREKKHRYGGGHKSYEEGIEPIDFRSIEYGGAYTEPPKCMDDKYVHSDLVPSYRHYYACEKTVGASWTDRSEPDWIESWR
jgi:hypothetical protein